MLHHVFGGFHISNRRTRGSRIRLHARAQRSSAIRDPNVLVGFADLVRGIDPDTATCRLADPAGLGNLDIDQGLLWMEPSARWQRHLNSHDSRFHGQIKSGKSNKEGPCISLQGPSLCLDVRYRKVWAGNEKTC